MSEVIQHDTDREAVREAFKELRRDGYFARMAFQCCSSCAWAEVPDAKAEKVVFYNRQAADAFKEDGGWYGGGSLTDDLQRNLYLQWAGDGARIVEVLNRHGLDAVWDGTDEQAVRVIGWTGIRREAWELNRRFDRRKEREALEAEWKAKDAEKARRAEFVGVL